jgi:hypothetical protein
LPGHDVVSPSVEEAEQSTANAMGVDKNMVQLAYYKELSKHLYALNKSAVAALDRVATIDTLETQLRHEVRNFEVDRKAIQKRLSRIGAMMQKENGEVWSEMVKFMAETGKVGESSKHKNGQNGEEAEAMEEEE